MLKKRLLTLPFYGKSFPTGLYSGERKNYSVAGPSCLLNSNELSTQRFFLCTKDLKLGPCPGLYGQESFWSTNRKMPTYNDCVHTKQNASFSLPFGCSLQGRSSWPEMPSQFQSCIREGWRTYGHNTAVPRSGLEIDDFFRSRAIASMTPDFESDFKALNFLFELKDFKGAVQVLGKLGNPNSSLWTTINRWQSVYGRALTLESFRKPVSAKAARIAIARNNGRSCAAVYADKTITAAAESWLTYTMAYLPLIKDLSAYVAAAATEYEAALSSFKKKGVVANTRHYSEMLRDASTYDVPVWNGTWHTVDKHVDYTRASATLQYKYGYDLCDQTKAFAKYWGLSGTLEEFWNMLPFSFLVDYFCKIGKALNMAQVDKNLHMETLQYCESILDYRGSITCTRPASAHCSFIVDGSNVDLDSKKWRPILGVYSSSYQRIRMSPPKVGLIVPALKLPSEFQQWNMLALAKVLFF